MPDFKIANPGGSQWGLVLDDGDLVLLDEVESFPEVVAQRIVYELMPWLGECAYDPAIGLPHLEILGSLEGAEGIAGLYVLAIQEVDGVAEIVDFGYTPPEAPDLALTIAPVVRVGNKEVALGLVIGGGLPA